MKNFPLMFGGLSKNDTSGHRSGQECGSMAVVHASGCSYICAVATMSQALWWALRYLYHKETQDPAHVLKNF